MREITSKDIMHIGFLKKECFTGSNAGMRYRMEMREQERKKEAAERGDGVETETVRELLVTVWPEPYAFDHTPEEEKESRAFSFNEEGVEAGRQWLNKRCAEEDWDRRRLRDRAW